MKIVKSSLGVVAVIVTFMVNAEMDHSEMNHDSVAQVGKAVLTESGTDPFAVMQEVIAVLTANPNTDWRKVNLEVLRLHLIEMQNMTLNVDVEQKPIKNGFQAIVTPITDRALKSLTKVLSAHPAQMLAETGWDMKVSNNHGVFTLIVTTNKTRDVAKIRGLGYIGVMAYGKHHQPHHLAIASGDNPHIKH